DYVTEKIFDCFLSKCIPIYLGAYNIEQIIPKELFIDYRIFENDNLSLYLKSMDNNKYNKMIEDAQDWMKENRYKKGSIDELEKTILR
ncbi:MAG TPA: glycosyltransferase family 10, partial [Caldisericia bacterium]|nr:glycosyltransferase family 10 [Caldisericia bacterium]